MTNVSQFNFIKDSRVVKKPEFFNDSKHLIIFASNGLKLRLVAHSRTDSKIMIDLPKNLSAIILTKKKLQKENFKKKNFYQHVVYYDFHISKKDNL